MKQPIKPMFMQTSETLIRPDCRVVIPAFVLVFVAMSAATCAQTTGYAQETDQAQAVEKTEREVELETQLAACRAEVEELKTPPQLEDDAYIQNIDTLQQRIEEATK